MTQFILPIIFILLSSVCKSIQDVLQFHFYTSIFNVKRESKLFTWLNPEFSWQLKWKENDRSLGEKFWGSSRWFVMFTDAWHLFDFLRIIFSLCSLVFFQYYIPFTTFRILDLLVYYILYSVLFDLLFSKLFNELHIS